jgi:hypothetical protein
MQRFLSIVLLALVAGIGGLTCAYTETIPAATDAPKPLSPEESRKRFRLLDGFRIELVAAEPHLAERTGMCFDARGRIFVCELHGYNLDGYYDIVELNKKGLISVYFVFPESVADQAAVGTISAYCTSRNGNGGTMVGPAWVLLLTSFFCQ